MPTPAGAPLRKVTLNLFEEDCLILEQGHGHGWSELVREWVHEHTWSYRKHLPRTLGDLDD